MFNSKIKGLAEKILTVDGFQISWEGTFFFDPADRIYRDHFPGNPVVPGSVIIHAFTRAVGRPVFGFQNFRFKRFVSPGEYRYRISLEEGRAKCRLLDAQGTAATGILNL